MTDPWTNIIELPVVRNNPRHMACTIFEVLLDNIIADQDTGNSHVGEAMRLEFGESVAASIMQAAGIRRLRLRHVASTQEATEAPS